MTEPRGFRKLYAFRILWVLLSIALLVLVVLSVRRHEVAYAVIYALLLAYAVARAAGWRMKPPPPPHA